MQFQPGKQNNAPVLRARAKRNIIDEVVCRLFFATATLFASPERDRLRTTAGAWQQQQQKSGGHPPNLIVANYGLRMFVFFLSLSLSTSSS